jgi:RNA polymerase sigma-70 factor, ECF subfamily
MGVTDENLMAAHLRGDKAAFRELVRRYAGSLMGYLFHMTGNRDQAEDLFQETFKKVYEKAHTFRGPRLKSWMFTIATRTALDAFRRRKHAPPISLDQANDCDPDNGSSLVAATVDPNATDPADDIVREEQAQQVRNAVETLPPRQRATLVLAYFQQLTYPEVAQVLDCSVGTVKTQMSRALARLAQQLPDSLSVTK